MHLYSLFIPSFRIFLTHYSSALNRSSFPETLLCYALNEVIDVIHLFLSKYVFLFLKSLLRIELIHDSMCDMSSRVDAINNSL